MLQCIPKRVVSFVYKHCECLDTILYLWCKLLAKLTGKTYGY